MSKLTEVSNAVIAAYNQESSPNHDKKISVNPVVAELATWYERFRTAMDYRDDEVILRAAIERILKRRLLMGGNGKNIAPPLIRELIWARYFPDSSVPENTILKVEHAIDLYLELERKVNYKHRINRMILNEWILHLLSSEIEHILKPNDRKTLMCNFIFQLFKDKVFITDDSAEIRDIQLFIAVRRSFAKDDLAFLRYHLFKQYFGSLTVHNLDKVTEEFVTGQKTIEEQFRYPVKDKIYNYIKNQTVPFLILDDVLRKNQGNLDSLLADENQLNLAVTEACNNRYKGIVGKVRRAIVRSVVFIFFTKAIFAIFVEGTFENFVYGKIIWTSMAINILTPALLMILVGLSIKTPTRENSFRILKKIHTILFDDPPFSDQALIVKKKPSKTDPILGTLFIILWFITFILSFGAIVFVLTKLEVNPISQGVFMVFLAIVSFVSYRINQTAHMYILKDNKESFSSLLFDFFFMPFIQVGRRLTVAISQINIILFIFDFIIETPFKGIFAFFEQWFLFLQTQREKLD